jgi:predicted PurR-regulated permease PerM
LNELRWERYRRRWGLPLLALLFFGGIAYAFRSVLLPFILALVIVFLMEPLVRRLCHLHVRRRQVPRWAAVVTVYLGFFSSVALFSVIFLPPLTAELGAAAEEIPAYLNRVREQDLPRWSAELERFLGRSKSTADVDLEPAVAEAREQVGIALQRATMVQELDELPFVDRSGASPLLLIEKNGMRPQLADADHQQRAAQEATWQSRVLFGIVKNPNGEGLWLVSGGNELRLVPQEDGSLTLRIDPAGRGETSTARFDLEGELMRSVSHLIESGTAYAFDILSFVQTVIEYVLSAFVMLILTFMVAAFVSIDLPKIMDFFRGFVPESAQTAYGELLTSLNRGLSGVIRGQLVICLINGVLTGVGLWVLDVDFALMLGIIAGVLSLIPIFGTIVSTIPAVLMGLMQGFSTAFLVLLWILVVHFFDANFFTPKIVGSSSKMHPVVIIFALLAGQSSFGIFGALLAVPVASIVQTLFVFLLERIRQANRSHPDSTASGESG